jgi:DNA-binding HxlR family transcriptional regulator
MKKRALPLNVFSAHCPTRRVIDCVSDKWAILVFLAIKDGSLRFNELRRTMQGVSQKMLTQTLRQLERDGFVLREVFPTVPVTVQYSLTTLGESLLAVIERIRVWAHAHAHELRPPTPRAIAATALANGSKAGIRA